MKKLKILMISKNLPFQFKGGVQTHTWQLANQLLKLGHDVSILCSGSLKNKNKRSKIDGIEVIQIPYFPGRRLLLFHTAAEELAFNWAVKNWVKQNSSSYDIIHVQGRSGYLLYKVASIKNKVVHTFHGLIDIERKWNSENSLDEKVHTAIAKYLENKMLGSVKHVVAVSHALKNDLMKFRKPKNDIEVIPTGIEVNRELISIQKKPSKFLYVGRLHPMKGLERLVNQMKNAPKHIKLDIIGDGELRKSLENIIRQKNLDTQVQLLGELDYTEIQQRMPDYKALVLPSFYETQGLVIQEAQVRGLPVIASNIPAIQESVSHLENGILCDPENPKAFIDAMKYLSENDTEAQNMGAKGYEITKNRYDWKLIINSVDSLYQKMAQA